MDDNDTSWCPVCDRQILPKRYQVPIIPQTQPVPPPPPPPSSPVRRSKSTRQRGGGLVQGTGRVKPNGGIKQAKQQQQQQQQQQPQPIKLRTVIDQGPTPLYCSDECHLVELNRGIPHNFNPDREQSKPASIISVSPTESSTTSSSIDSQSSIESTPSTTQMSPSLATLAAIYNFPPLPPPAPVDDERVTPSCPRSEEYTTGVMMAARRIKKDLCSNPQKRDCYGSTEPRKPIPGWTDGSNAWRSTIYNLTAPNSSSPPLPHKSFATRGNRGVHSSLSESASYSRTSASLPTYSTSESDAELLTRFSQSFRRSSHSSTPLSPPPLSSSPSSASSFPPIPSPQKRERSLLQRGAEGKLLVPPVMMRVNSASHISSSSQSSRRSVRSPLSRASSSSDEDEQTQRCDSATSLSHSLKRPTVETRSWSYDNVKTYPIMRLPPKKRIEKRVETRVIDGEEVEVEVEVEVEIEEKLKRLFHFSPPATTLSARA